LHGGQVTYVGDPGEHPVRTQFADHTAQRHLVDVGEDHLGAPGVQAARHLGADPGGTAGDEDDFAGHWGHVRENYSSGPRKSTPSSASTAAATAPGASGSSPPYSSASVHQPSSAASALGVSRSSARYRRNRATTSVASGPAGSAVALRHRCSRSVASASS